jgi:hypothetical protein
METDTPFTLPGMEPPPASPQDLDLPRPLIPGFLPDGSRLHLTAGILLDLADHHYEDFLDYRPSSPAEFAMLLYMAAHAARQPAPGPWHVKAPEQPRPLINDVHGFRAEVSRWVSEAFRPSEFPYVTLLGVDLWVSANKGRVVPSIVQKKTEEAVPPSTSPPEPPSASTLSPAETSAPETTPSTSSPSGNSGNASIAS